MFLTSLLLFLAKMSLATERVLFRIRAFGLQTWETDHAVWTAAEEYIDDSGSDEENNLDLDLYCYEVMDEIF